MANMLKKVQNQKFELRTFETPRYDDANEFEVSKKH
jgi:hypothetical protein